jgi:Glycosyltransferase WbsX
MLYSIYLDRLRLHFVMKLRSLQPFILFFSLSVLSFHFHALYNHVTCYRDVNINTPLPTSTVYSPWTRLAMNRVKQLSAKTSDGDNDILATIVVFVQVYRYQALDTILKCLMNIVTSVASNGNIDVFICYDLPNTSLDEIKSSLVNVPSIRKIFIEECFKGENHASMFLRQVQIAESQKHGYNMVLKINGREHEDFMHNSEAMCGTPEQITSIRNYFHKEILRVGVVVPKGTSRIVTLYKRELFDEFCNRYLSSCPLVSEDMHSIAGGMFWTLWKPLIEYKSLMKINESRYLETYSYFPDFFETSWTYFIRNKNLMVSEIMPAPRVLAFFFPQYHEIPENNRFWGKGFTEWTWLKPSNLSDIKKPLSWKEGGLGYYDLTSKTVRIRQGAIAQNFGISGFVFYHYWFNGKAAPTNHKVMFKPLELMLADGHPDLPFMLSWANEPWDRHWTGGGSQDVTNEILMEQKYGNKSDWEEHFHYLSQFFKHENYIKLEGKPMLIIYRIGHIGENFVDMITLWRNMAFKLGFPGLHVIETIGSFYNMDKMNTELERYVDAAVHFWPAASAVKWTGKFASSENLPVKPLTQYWGSYSGFDKRVRDSSATYYPVNVSLFEESLRLSFHSLSTSYQSKLTVNLYFITAWNEWNEQAVLEPDSKNKFAYLSSISESLKSIPLNEIPDRKLLLDSVLKEDNCTLGRVTYLKMYPDVARAEVDPWRHFLNQGMNEGRKWLCV